MRIYLAKQSVINHPSPAIFVQQIPCIEIVAGEANIISREYAVGQAVVDPERELSVHEWRQRQKP